jgi:alpha-1,3-rhamnosyl/mannosyltransferase
MRIAFDARLLHRRVSGLERYMEHLARELTRIPGLQVDVLVRAPHFKGHEVREVLTPGVEQMLGYLGQSKPALYHLTWLDYRASHYACLGFVPSTVLTVPDLILYLDSRLLPRGIRLAYRRLLRWAVTLADRVVVYSRFSRDELERHLGVRKERVHVVALGVDQRFGRPDETTARLLRDRYDIPGRYVLALGKDYPHKNLDTLLAAWERLATDPSIPHQLVLAGEHGAAEPDHRLRRRVEAGRMTDRVRLIGHVPDDLLPALYDGADLFVYPSRYEAFGLPVLEAMASGVPVVAASAASIPEVVGRAGLLVDPESPEALAAAMARVLTTPGLRTQLIADGKVRARAFTWQTAAAETAAVYEACRSGHAERGSRRFDIRRRLLRAGGRLERGLEHFLAGRRRGRTVTA